MWGADDRDMARVIAPVLAWSPRFFRMPHVVRVELLIPFLPPSGGIARAESAGQRPIASAGGTAVAARTKPCDQLAALRTLPRSMPEALHLAGPLGYWSGSISRAQNGKSS